MPRQKRNFYKASEGQLQLIGAFSTPARAALRTKSNDAVVFEQRNGDLAAYKYKVETKPIEGVKDQAWLAERSINHRRHATQVELTSNEKAVLAHFQKERNIQSSEALLERFPSVALNN